jgi:DNA-binding LacI/PurR family transcriptional regulator
VATVRDVAHRAGVSVSLVSAVLRSSKTHVRYSEQTRRRVLEAASHLGYRRHPVSTALRTGRTRVVGVYLGDAPALFTHPHGAHALSHLQQALVSRGYSLLIVSLDASRPCDFRQMDGLVIMGSREGDAAMVQRAAEATPTFGWLGMAVPNARGCRAVGDEAIRAVITGNHETAARYLYGLGHRSIGLIEPWGARAADAALPIFQRIAEERGLKVELADVYDYLSPRMYPNAMRFLDRDPLPTAIYALDDAVALRVIQKLGWRGMSAPGHVSVFSRQTEEATPDGLPGVTGILTDWPACWRDLVGQYVDVIEGRMSADRIRAIVPAQRVVEGTTCGPPRVGASA